MHYELKLKVLSKTECSQHSCYLIILIITISELHLVLLHP